MPKEEREVCGEAGYDWVTGEESNMSAKNMCKLMVKYIEGCFTNWTPRKRFTMYKSEPKQKIEKPGVII
jgi:AAA+ superfamily predicted ATPase